MKIKPDSKPQATEERVHEVILKHRDLIPPSDPVLVVAWRGYYLDSMGEPGENDRGLYDDARFIIAPDHFSSYNSNVDPSRFRSGIATLEAPQLIRFKPGYHGYGRKSGHPAFRQDSDVIVRRDGGAGGGTPLGDGRFKDSPGDRFWTNDHRGGIHATNSAGCLTTPPSQWPAYYETLLDLIRRYDLDYYNLLLVEDPRI